jgi:tripartite-type tricarboxylate transporter receptor subunit TctC
MKRLLSLLLPALLATLAAFAVAAQPAGRPVRLVVPTPAGGPSDAAARSIAQALARSLGQPVIVENRPGAGGAIAAQAVLAAPPDGTTLLWGIASMGSIPMLQKTPPFRSLAEFTPVSLVGHFTFGVFVHPGVPARSIAELAAYGRANPDKLAYGTGTLGEYLAAAQWVRASGMSAVRVPYKGGTQVMPDLLAGRVQFNIGPVSSGLPHVKEGKLRMLAVLAPQRIALAPEVPTLAEAGAPSVSLPTWQAIFAPPKTPAEVAERLSRELAALLRDPALRSQLEQQALLVGGSSPAELAALVASDEKQWQAFVRDYEIPQE